MWLNTCMNVKMITQNQLSFLRRELLISKIWFIFAYDKKGCGLVSDDRMSERTDWEQLQRNIARLKYWLLKCIICQKDIVEELVEKHVLYGKALKLRRERASHLETWKRLAIHETWKWLAIWWKWYWEWYNSTAPFKQKTGNYISLPLRQSPSTSLPMTKSLIHAWFPCI